MLRAHSIVPCLWFDGQAEEAARHYTGIFPRSRIGTVTRYSEAGREEHGKEPGTVLTVEFELDGQQLLALNGGPGFRFNEAVSLLVVCETQQEIDHYWKRLGANPPEERQCGWLKDKFGVSWQIAPTIVPDLFAGPDAAASKRAMLAMMQMKKLDIAALQRAYAG